MPSESDFGSSRAVSKVKNNGFPYGKHSFLKIDLSPLERLRGRIWTPKWSQNRHQNRPKIYRKSYGKSDAKKMRRRSRNGAQMEPKWHPGEVRESSPGAPERFTGAPACPRASPGDSRAPPGAPERAPGAPEATQGRLQAPQNTKKRKNTQNL